MSLRKEIQERQIAALKSKDAETLAVLRFVFSAIKNKEIDKKAELNDEEAQAVIAFQVKQLKDALKDFEAGGRQDLVDKTKAEIAILTAYLPEKMSEEELLVVVEKVIESVGAKSAQDAGRVMGAVMKEVKGRADGNQVREMVMKKLIS